MDQHLEKSRRSRKAQQSQKSRSRVLPLWLREKGIYTQKELAAALLPYMEWVAYKDFRQRFFNIIDTHGSDAPLRCILRRLHSDGVIEKKYEGRPVGVTKEIEPYLSGYLFIRRIKKSVPRTACGIKKKADGSYGMASDKKKAQQALKATKKQKPPKTTVKDLTIDDLRYIQSKPDGISDRALAEMFNVHISMVVKIRKGHVPAHLKGPLARQRSLDNQAGI